MTRTAAPTWNEGDEMTNAPKVRCHICGAPVPAGTTREHENSIQHRRAQDALRVIEAPRKAAKR